MSADREAPVTWLSREGYEKLQAELNQLIANRPIIAAEINARREEGDLRENSGYHAAREEQGKQEARIRQLQELLRNAKVGDAPEGDRVSPGTVVTVYFDDDPKDTETFLLGSRELAASTDLTVYSPESALGTAIIGARAGETVTYTAPSGADVKVTVTKLEPYTG
ncbi:MAG TPA: transcription elongation factor GreA [Natronosporangium sp.]|nr:transcription elongation factor GreA [Natronosporangium sp.]